MFAAIKNWLANLHKLPEAQMAGYRAEGLVAIDNWIKAKLTYRNFKAPGKRFGYKTVWFRSIVVLTKERFFATVYGRLGIDVQFSDERFRTMKFSVEDDGRLLVAFDASLLQPDWSGQLEYRFTTAKATEIVMTIHQEAPANG